MTILALVLPILLGYFVVRLAWPNGWRVCRHDLLRASLGAGLGLGIGSMLFFLARSMAAPQAALPLEGILVVALAGACAWFGRGQKCVFCDAPAGGADQREIGSGWLFGSGALLIAAAAMATYALFSIMAPVGEWDAWSIWNLRAKFLALGGDHWRDGFSTLIAWSHPDYPLLVPASIAQVWQAAGGDSPVAPILVQGILLFACAGLLYAGVEILRGRTQAALALLALLGASTFARNGAAQYADIPLSFFILAAALLMILEERFSTAGVLAGLSLGFAAWTKNEGLLFVAAALVARAVFLRPSVMCWARLGAGFAPAAAVVVFFKLHDAPANDLLASAKLSRLAEFGRYWAVTYEFVHQILIFGGYVISPVLVLGVYAWLLGVPEEQKRSRANRALLAMLALMLAGDFAIYILSANDLDWQLGTSLSRVLLQVWPLTVLTLFAFLAAPKAEAVEQKPVAAEKPAKARKKAAARKAA
jgi:hypothetical protein